MKIKEPQNSNKSHHTETREHENSGLSGEDPVSIRNSLEKSVFKALQTYSNVHRGSGHKSKVTTHLFEVARKIVLEYLSLSNREYYLIFSSAINAPNITDKINPWDFKVFSSRDLGLDIGVKAIAVRKSKLRKVDPDFTGGGTARLTSINWTVWASLPGKFEPGTPAVLNIICFAKALLICRKYGRDVFQRINFGEYSSNDILFSDISSHRGKDLLLEIRASGIGGNLSVPTKNGNKTFVNLDNAASTPSFQSIWNSFRKALRLPEKTKINLLSDTRKICAKFLGAPEDLYDILFTTNATEALNLMVKSFSRETAGVTIPVYVNTLMEHSSNDLPWRKLPNADVLRLPVGKQGLIEESKLEALLKSYNQDRDHGKKRIRLVSFAAASNVVGNYNNIREISRIVHKYGALLAVDASQMVAHRRIDMKYWNIDFLAFSGHKAYAPFGSGALIARRGILNFSGDEMEKIRSSGEENIAGIAAMGKAFELINRIGFNVIQQEEEKLTIKMISGFSGIPGLKIYGGIDSDKPEFAQKGAVLAFGFKKIMSDRVAKKLAEEDGVGVRYGCHCAHIFVKHILDVGPGLEKFQRVIVSLLPGIQLPGVTRVSLGIGNIENDIDRLISQLNKIAIGNNTHAKKKEDGAKANSRINENYNRLIDDFIKNIEEEVFFNTETETEFALQNES